MSYSVCVSYAVECVWGGGFPASLPFPWMSWVSSSSHRDGGVGVVGLPLCVTEFPDVCVS